MEEQKEVTLDFEAMDGGSRGGKEIAWLLGRGWIDV
jgi:hypothetical protein